VRGSEALESYSAALNGVEREFEDLSYRSRGVASDSAEGPQTIPSVAEIQRLLTSGTALVEYVVGNKSVSILVVTRGSVTGLSAPVASESLATRIELLRDLIAERKPEWRQPAKSLRTLLVDPLRSAGHLSQIRNLVIVPDGVLNYVPFAALPTEGSRFLGDEFTIAYLPSAVMLTKQASATAGRNAVDRERAVLHRRERNVPVRLITSIRHVEARLFLSKTE
jgi:CHAT domain-containing protein